jgi:hypothetical protein
MPSIKDTPKLSTANPSQPSSPGCCYPTPAGQYRFDCFQQLDTYSEEFISSVNMAQRLPAMTICRHGSIDPARLNARAVVSGDPGIVCSSRLVPGFRCWLRVREFYQGPAQDPLTRAPMPPGSPPTLVERGRYYLAKIAFALGPISKIFLENLAGREREDG